MLTTARAQRLELTARWSTRPVPAPLLARARATPEGRAQVGIEQQRSVGNSAVARAAAARAGEETEERLAAAAPTPTEEARDNGPVVDEANEAEERTAAARILPDPTTADPARAVANPATTQAELARAESETVKAERDQHSSELAEPAPEGDNEALLAATPLAAAEGDAVLSGPELAAATATLAEPVPVGGVEAAEGAAMSRGEAASSMGAEATAAESGRALQPAAPEQGWLARTAGTLGDVARSGGATLGTFAGVAMDIAADPLGWLRALGASVMDGVRNHLWPRLKDAVQEWFQGKLDQVLGLGQVIYGWLARGGLNLAAIGRFAWQALQAALPPMLISLLIQKLVSLLIPAAGGLLTIVEGLKAAWASMGRILQSINRFTAFLRAVKTGVAGPQFASLLASAAVALLDFVANGLMARLVRVAASIGAKLRRLATSIAKKLRRFWRGVRVGTRRMFRRLARSFARTRSGRILQQRLGARPTNRQTRPDNRQDDRNRQRLEGARQSLRRLLRGGLSRARLMAAISWLRIRFGLQRVNVTRSGRVFTISATINPTEDLVTGRVISFEYTPEGNIEGSGQQRRAILSQLGMLHTAKGHEPDVQDQTLINNARMQGGSGKWLSDKYMIEAAKLAKTNYPNAESGREYIFSIPLGWAKGYRRVGSSENISQELFLLPDEGPTKRGVIEATITRARAFFNRDGNVRSVHPYAELGG